MTQINDPRLTKYLRKIERKAGQINSVQRERGLNAVFDLLEELDEEKYKAQTRINDLRFRRPNGSRNRLVPRLLRRLGIGRAYCG